MKPTDTKSQYVPYMNKRMVGCGQNSSSTILYQPELFHLTNL